MAPIILMPSVDELAAGPRREFVQELHERYRAAKWPSLRKVELLLSQKDDLAGMASKETIRRMLHGHVVPRNWDTVDAALIALCELAGTSPEAHQLGEAEIFGVYGEPGPTHREALLSCWQNAIEALRVEAASTDKPNAQATPGQAFSDEPPF